MLIQVSPVLIALLAAMFLHERFTLYLGLGLALAFGGVGLIATSPSDSQRRPQRPRRRALPGRRGGLLDQPDPAEAAGRQAARDPRDLAGLHRRRGRVPAVRWASWSTRRATRRRPSIWWVVYLGVFPTAIAFTTFAYALRHMSASSLGVTTYLVPPITIVMGWLFLDETPPAMAYVGGALALVGVAVARRKPRTLAGAGPAPLSPAMICAVSIVANVLVGLVAALHLYFLVLEMFLWTPRPGTRRSASSPPSPPRARRWPPTRASTTGSWPPASCGDWSTTADVKLFFLACVIVAGAYGAATVNRRILFVQALPALVGFVLVLAASWPLVDLQPAAERLEVLRSTRRAACATPTPCGWRRRSRARGSC